MSILSNSNPKFSIQQLLFIGILGVVVGIPLLGGGNEFYRISPSAGKTLISFITVFLFLGWWLAKLKQWIWSPWPRTLSIAVIAFLFLFGVSTYFTDSPGTSGTHFLILITGLGLGFLISEVCKTSDHLNMSAWALLLGGGLAAAFGIEQAVFGLPRWLQEAQANRASIDLVQMVSQGRIFSTFFNVNSFAAHLVMVLPIGCYLLLNAKKWQSKLLVACIILLIICALAFTSSKGGWATAILVIAYMIYSFDKNRGNWQLTKYLGIIGLASILFVGTYWGVQPKGIENPIERFISNSMGIKISTEGRLSYWKGAIKIIKDNPWLGTGLGTFGLSYQRYQSDGYYSRYAHSLYLQMASEVGVIGLLSFGWMVLSLWHLKRGLTQNQKLSTFLWIGMMALLIHGMVDFSWLAPANQWFFFVMGGMIVACWRIEYRKEEKVIRFTGLQRWILYGGAVPITVLLVLGVIRPYFAEGYLQAAIAASISDDTDRAIALAHESVRFGPRLEKAKNFLATAYLRKWEKEREPLWLLKAKEMNQGAIQLAPKVGLYKNEYGKTLWGMREYRDAIEQWRFAHSNYPVNPTFAVDLGRGLWKMGNEEKAIQLLKKASRMEKPFLKGGNQELLPFFHLHLLLGEIYKTQGFRDKALGEYRQIVELSGRVPQRIAFGPLLAGRIAIPPKLWFAPRGYLEMGDLYQQKGLPEKALVSYKKALRLDANNLKVKKRIEDLRRKTGEIKG